MTAIGYKIRKIRELKNLSQDYVSSKLGIGQTSYSRIETGQQKLEIGQLIELSKILEVDPMDIVNFDDNHIFNNHHQAGGYAANVIINNLSQELINSYEARIKHLEEEINYFRQKSN